LVDLLLRKVKQIYHESIYRDRTLVSFTCSLLAAGDCFDISIPADLAYPATVQDCRPHDRGPFQIHRSDPDVSIPPFKKLTDPASPRKPFNAFIDNNIFQRDF
jgi:hypothetical protein